MCARIHATRHSLILSLASVLSATASLQADVQFASPVTHAVGTTPVSVATGDFNGDSHLDLVCANTDSNNISVLFGAGDGSFGSATNYAVGTAPRNVVVGDLDGDKKLDIAVANHDSRDFSVLLNQGDGSFEQAVHYAATNVVNDLHAVDLDGDTDYDVALSLGEYNGTLDTLEVFLNSGNGTFGNSTVYTDIGVDALAVYSELVDTDGDQDVLMTDHNRLYWFENLGDGQLEDARNLPASASNSPTAIVTGDWNLDQHRDIAVSMGINHGVQVLVNNADGSFDSTHYNTAANSQHVATGDLNRDGIQDLVTTHPGTENFRGLSILLGNGDGTFQPWHYHEYGTSPKASVLGDFDEDGRADVAIADGDDDAIIVLLNQTPEPLFAPPLSFPVGAEWPRDVRVVDLDNDLDLDAVTIPQDADGSYIAVIRNSGEGRFSAPELYQVGLDLRSVRAEDLNDDTFVDLVVCDYKRGDYGVVYLLFNNGNGTFGAPVELPLSQIFPKDVAVADLDNDNYLDIAVPDSNDTRMYVFYGLGGGNYESPVDYFIGDDQIYKIEAADLNNDQFPELMWVEFPGGNAFTVMMNNGNRTFGDRTYYRTGDRPISLVLEDFNGDTFLDVATSNEIGGSQDVSVLINNGDGTLGSATNYNIGASAAEGMVGADLDNDDDVDLAVVAIGSRSTHYLFNDGSGIFVQSGFTYLDHPAWDIAAGDLDDDDDADLFAVSYTEADSAWVLLNTTIEDNNYFPMLRLDQTSLIRGQQTQFRVSRANPNEVVYFVYSLRGLGNSPPIKQLGGLRLDLRLPIEILDTVVADEQGVAVYQLKVPSNVPLIDLGTQAVVRRGRGGRNSVKSLPILDSIQN